MPSSTSKYVSINVQPEHMRALDKLVAASGVNRNQFLRKLIMSLTPDDVKKIMRR